MIELERGGRTVAKNHCCQLPRYIFAVDTETLPMQISADTTILSHKLRLGYYMRTRIVDDKECGTIGCHFKSSAEFWDAVYKSSGPRHTIWIVAHNTLFDFISLCGPAEFEHGQLIIDKPRVRRAQKNKDGTDRKRYGLGIIDSPPTIIGCRISSTQGRVVFVDTMNWFRCPLSQLGEQIGQQKMQMPAFSEPDEVWAKYCKNDAEIVMRTFVQLIQWNKKNDMGQFRYTGPSQAMSAFRHRFMGHNIYTHENVRAKALERDSYFGGRTEVFRMGEISERVYQLDISALFPSVMVGNLYPYTLDCWENRKEFSNAIPPFEPSEMIAKVEVDTSVPIYPERGERITYYPTGRFQTTLSGPELFHAFSCGHIVSWGSWAHYKTKPLFTTWVNELWSMRRKYEDEGNTIYAAFCKMLMNSLYGKFGQRSPEWEDFDGEPVAMPWSRWCKINVPSGIVSNFRSIGYQCQKKSDRGEVKGNFPAISAFVCSYARLRMNIMREISGPRNCYYQGVDSVIVNQAGMDRLSECGYVRDRDLGYLRLVGTYESGCIRGNSDYTLGDKNIVAGRASNAEEMANGVYTQCRFLAKDRLFSGRAIDTIEQKSVTWSKSSVYKKSDMGPDGFMIPPHRHTVIGNSVANDSFA
jgi:hypothetical protein